MKELCIISHEHPYFSAIPVELWSPAIGKFAIEMNTLKSDEFQLSDEANEVNKIYPLIYELYLRSENDPAHKRKCKKLLNVFFDDKYKIRKSRGSESAPDIAVFSANATVPEIIVVVKQGHQGSYKDPLVESLLLQKIYL